MAKFNKPELVDLNADYLRSLGFPIGKKKKKQKNKSPAISNEEAALEYVLRSLEAHQMSREESNALIQDLLLAHASSGSTTLFVGKRTAKKLSSAPPLPSKKKV